MSTAENFIQLAMEADTDEEAEAYLLAASEVEE